MTECKRLQDKLDLQGMLNGFCEQDDIETLRDRYWGNQFKAGNCKMKWPCGNGDGSSAFSLFTNSPAAAAHQTFLLIFLFMTTFFFIYGR
ncbi:unnamed protein product [Oikopleura dioica]|nr:unnamed protein product [Oikopleura dioica]